MAAGSPAQVAWKQGLFSKEGVTMRTAVQDPGWRSVEWGPQDLTVERRPRELKGWFTRNCHLVLCNLLPSAPPVQGVPDGHTARSGTGAPPRATWCPCMQQDCGLDVAGSGHHCGLERAGEWRAGPKFHWHKPTSLPRGRGPFLGTYRTVCTELGVCLLHTTVASPAPSARCVVPTAAGVKGAVLPVSTVLSDHRHS